MSRPLAVLPAAFLLALSACGDPPPCTECASVAGLYDLVADGTDPSQEASCSAVSFGARSGVASLQQDGAELTLDTFWHMTGTLFENDQFSFDPVRYESWSGTVTVMLSGTFSGAEGAKSVVGNFVFSAQDQGCTLSSPMRMTQQE